MRWRFQYPVCAVVVDESATTQARTRRGRIERAITSFTAGVGIVQHEIIEKYSSPFKMFRKIGARYPLLASGFPHRIAPLSIAKSLHHRALARMPPQPRHCAPVRIFHSVRHSLIRGNAVENAVEAISRKWRVMSVVRVRRNCDPLASLCPSLFTIPINATDHAACGRRLKRATIAPRHCSPR